MIISPKIAAERAEPIFDDRLSQTAHKRLQEPQIVEGQKPQSKNFTGADEVADVSAGKPLATSIAPAIFFDGAKIVGINLILDDDTPRPRHGHAVARHPGGEDTVKQINPPGYAFYSTIRRSHAH